MQYVIDPENFGQTLAGFSQFENTAASLASYGITSFFMSQRFASNNRLKQPAFEHLYNKGHIASGGYRSFDFVVWLEKLDEDSAAGIGFLFSPYL